MDPHLTAQLAAVLAFLPTVYAYTSAGLAAFSAYLAIAGAWQGVAFHRLLLLAGASFCLFWIASDQLRWERPAPPHHPAAHARGAR